MKKCSLEVEIHRLEFDITDAERPNRKSHGADEDWEDSCDYEEWIERLPVAKKELALYKSLRIRAEKLPSLPIPPLYAGRWDWDDGSSRGCNVF